MPSLNAAPWLPALTTACLAPRAAEALRRRGGPLDDQLTLGLHALDREAETSVSASARLGLTTSGCAVSALARTAPVESTTLRRPV